jgi:hypothetical protein
VSVRTRLLNLLLLAALALAASRLWLFLREPPPALPAPPAVAASPAAGGLRREPPAPPPEPQPESYDLIVARDVFSPARGVVPPAPAAAAKPAEKPQPPPKVTLFGVVILDGQKTAYLQEGSAEGRPRKIREGERFAGGIVSAIRPDGVTFLFGGNEVAVPLRTPKEGAPGLQPPVPGAGAVQRPETPAPVPRRLPQPSVQQGRPAAPVRQVPAAPVVPRFTPPVEPLDNGGEEYFPEDASDELDAQDVIDEELEE